MQLMLCEDGGIHEAVRGTGVEESLHRDRRLPRDQELDGESQVTGDGGGDERGGNRTAQLGSYWLGKSFFGTSEVGVPKWGLGTTAQGPGKGPWKGGN